METLGVWLRQLREARDETLRDVEAATRIRVRFLRMLEEGEFDALPGGEVQVRGFLRIYARHLDLSPREVLARYDEEMRHVEPAPAVAPVVESPPAQPVPAAPPARPVARPTPPRPGRPASSPMPQWLSLETLIITCIVLIILLVIVIAAMVIVGRGRGGEEAATTVAPVTASAGAVTLSMEAATPPPATPTFPVDPQGYVMLTLDSMEHVWVRVTVDGMTAFEGMLDAGQSETWSGKEEVIVETGNGAGLQVTVNGQSQGTMCGRAETCARGWGPEGEIAVP